MLETVIVAVAVLLDRLSKIWAMHSLTGLPNMQTTLIPGVLDLHYVQNTGAAFSMMQGMRWLFIPITLIIVGVLTFYLVKQRKTESIYTRIALASVIGGALGNLVDRIIYGYVVDMLEPSIIAFAVFNVADVFVTCGTIALVELILFSSSEGTKKTVSSNEAPCEKESI